MIIEIMEKKSKIPIAKKAEYRSASKSFMNIDDSLVEGISK
jgi:hypothetical protein